MVLVSTVTETNETDLVAAILRKDRKAMAEFVSRYADKVYSYVRHRLIPREDMVEDLVQDVFLVGLAGLKEFRSGSSLDTWLLGIARNKVSDYYRSRLREPMADEDGRGEHQDRPRGKQPEHVPGFEAGAWQREADDDEDHHDQRIDHRLGTAAGDQSPTRQAVAIRHDLNLHYIACGRWHHRIHQGANECGAEEPEERRSPDFRQRDLPLPGMHSARAGVDRQREEEPAVFSLRERAAKLLEIELPGRHAEQQADNQDLDQPAIGGDPG